MSESFRQGKRQPAQLPVQVRCAEWTDFIKLHVDNISLGGLFIRSQELLPIGSLVDVEVSLPDGHGAVNLSGQVVHVVANEATAGGKPRGMGIKLAELSAEQEGHLKALLDIGRLASSGATTVTAAGGAPALLTPNGEADSASALDEAALFDQVHEGHTGRISITAELAVAAAEKLVEQKHYAAARRELMQVLAEDPQHTKARTWLLVIDARILKAEGKTDEAMQTYTAVLDLDEQHREAVEEVRRGSNHKGRASSGLLSRFLGR